ncbi:hypothetical protein [Streptomyces sp. NPDC007205]|uniref:hypothetical protein n=1 Tax=Streptomyces sp. NPDC007205 TaxID=3154316 RepID=UPI0033FE773D
MPTAQPASLNTAARELGLNRRTVRKYARDATPLRDWLGQLTAAGIPAPAGLAKAIREDQPSVVQGITTPFNSGVNEGRITDLKPRSGSQPDAPGAPLLRHRVIHMALLRRHYP